MVNECNIYENLEYKFVNFNNLLYTIFHTFLDDTDIFEREFPVTISSGIMKSYLKHSTLVEVLKTYSYINACKTNAIIIGTNLEFNSNGLLKDDDEFKNAVLKTIDLFKRNIPLLIKRVESDFDDIALFIESGEGQDFLASIDTDREKLRNKVNSFEQFKKFARKEKLIYIIENLIDKIEFKRLFIS